MNQPELPIQVYEFLAWLSHRGLAIRDKLPQEFEAPLVVALAAEPPLVHIFNTGIVDEGLEIEGEVVPLPPHLGVRLTFDGSAAIALFDMQPTGGESHATKPTRGISLDAKALSVFIEHPDWTKKKIAEHLGCNAKSLTPKRCPKLKDAIAAYKAKPTTRRGSKDSDGNVEAWDG